MFSIPSAFGRQTLQSATSERFSTSRRRRAQSGFAVVEFAIVAPVVFLLIMGALQLASIFVAQRQLLGAATSGARIGSIEGSTTATVTSAITTYLSSTSIGANFTSNITGVSTSSDENTTVVVTVSHNFPITFRIPMIARLNAATVPLSATVTVRHE